MRQDNNMPEQETKKGGLFSKIMLGVGLFTAGWFAKDISSERIVVQYPQVDQSALSNDANLRKQFEELSQRLHGLEANATQTEDFRKKYEQAVADSQHNAEVAITWRDQFMASYLEAIGTAHEVNAEYGDSVLAKIFAKKWLAFFKEQLTIHDEELQKLIKAGHADESNPDVKKMLAYYVKQKANDKNFTK